MLFHSFSSQEERRSFGGSDFIELQHGKLDASLPMEELVSVHRIPHWREDSLYLQGDDWEQFDAAYGDILTGGTNSDLNCGPLDWCGINYFSPQQTAAICQQLKEQQPIEWDTLLRWLEEGKEAHGFYVLGL